MDVSSERREAQSKVIAEDKPLCETKSTCCTTQVLLANYTVINYMMQSAFAKNVC